MLARVDGRHCPNSEAGRDRRGTLTIDDVPRRSARRTSAETTEGED